MVARSDFARVASAGWEIFVREPSWNSAWQNEMLALVNAQPRARHPQTLQLHHRVGATERDFYLKVFHRMSPLSALKDFFRDSRAYCSWRQGIALTEAGFNAPVPSVVGKENGWRIAKREFTLTPRIGGILLTDYLGRQFATGSAPVFAKREQTRTLARLIKRFHDAGFVHGDLVATNIFVSTSDLGAVQFFFMDNDRTRYYPKWLPQGFWKRNLIQLNRLPLPGISLQDRMRFLHAYMDVRRLSKAERRFARWLEAKTRERRRECDGADPSGSFRRLMRWSPEVAEANHG